MSFKSSHFSPSPSGFTKQLADSLVSLTTHLRVSHNTFALSFCKQKHQQ